MESPFLRHAIDLAIEKISLNQGGPFGALVVRDDKIIGRGWNQVIQHNDPTAHAEVIAIRDACAVLGNYSLAGCEIYSSCEPCPMCMAAILWARIEQVIYAASASDASAVGFDDMNFYSDLAKPAEQRSIPTRQLLQTEGQRVFQQWLRNPDRQLY